MQKLKPDVIGFLSDSILKEKYNPPSYKLSSEVQDFCANSKGNIYRTFLVHQRYVINNLIVDTVLSSLEPKQAKFILYKYKENRTLNWISAKLDISIKTLKTWNAHINGHIQNMLFYNLDTDELFNVQALINMTNILDLRIESILWGAHVGGVINKDWVVGLCRRREYYRRVLQHLTECQARPDDTLYNWIISCKCHYPTLPMTEFTAKAAINKATIYRHLKKFADNAQGFYRDALELDMDARFA